MVIINATTAGGDVQLQHEARRLSLVEGQDIFAQAWWGMFLSRPPIGADGHLLFVNDCSLRDVAEALGDELSGADGRRLQSLMQSLIALPEGALP